MTTYSLTNGHIALSAHLLEHCSLSPEAKALARELLLTDGLHPLPLTVVGEGTQPLALWRSVVGQGCSIEVVLLDLGGGGTVAIQLPKAALVHLVGGCRDEDLYAAVPHR